MKASVCILLATLGASTTHAATQLQVLKAEWGKAGGPYCDATQGDAASCSKWMSQDGALCNGDQKTIQVPETAQLTMRCDVGNKPPESGRRLSACPRFATDARSRH